MSDDRAVSEVLGYVLIISLVTVVIVIVMTTGFNGLEASQRGEQIKNMERGFDVLAHNVEEVTTRGAPSRGTELRLVDGELRYGDPVTFDVTINGTLIENRSVGAQPLVYDSGSDTRIIYEGGAVIRMDGEHGTMLREPNFLIAEDAILVDAIRTRPLSGSRTSFDRTGTVLLRGEFLGSDGVNTTISDDETLEISVESPNVDAWESYFEDFQLGEVSRNGNTTTLRIQGSAIEDGTEVYFRRTRTRFSLLD